jgi:hypothetical protein
METLAESSGQPQLSRSGWGGRRRGAGRRPRDVGRWIAARGLKPASAAEILERADERAIWYRLLHSEDEAIVLRPAMYLTDRREGRPAQQINVTSLGVTISANEIAQAKAIVRELVSAHLAPSLHELGEGSPLPEASDLGQ